MTSSTNLQTTSTSSSTSTTLYNCDPAYSQGFEGNFSIVGYDGREGANHSVAPGIFVQGDVKHSGDKSLHAGGDDWQEELLSATTISQNHVVRLMVRLENQTNVQGIGFASGNGSARSELDYKLSGAQDMSGGHWNSSYAGLCTYGAWCYLEIPLGRDWNALYNSSIDRVTYISAGGENASFGLFYLDDISIINGECPTTTSTTIPVEPTTTTSSTTLTTGTSTSTSATSSSTTTSTTLHYIILYDYGDAPDSTNHAEIMMSAYPKDGPIGVWGGYPTVFESLHSYAGRCHEVMVNDIDGLSHLGFNVTWEADADVAPSQDNVTNIDPALGVSDRDGGDDGLYLPLNFLSCVPASITVNVTVGKYSLNKLYLNAWFDWNRNGQWGDVDTCFEQGDAPEWAVRNYALSNLTLGSHTLTTPAFLPKVFSNGSMWVRLSLSEVASNFSDGRGPGYCYYEGETEDYYIPVGIPSTTTTTTTLSTTTSFATSSTVTSSTLTSTTIMVSTTQPFTPFDTPMLPPRPPTPVPNCYNGLEDRDVEGVDCGGAFCNPCPTTTLKPPTTTIQTTTTLPRVCPVNVTTVKVIQYLSSASTTTTLRQPGIVGSFIAAALDFGGGAYWCAPLLLLLIPLLLLLALLSARKGVVVDEEGFKVMMELGRVKDEGRIYVPANVVDRIPDICKYDNVEAVKLCDREMWKAREILSKENVPNEVIQIVSIAFKKGSRRIITDRILPMAVREKIRPIVNETVTTDKSRFFS